MELNSNTLILHQYEISPFSEKVRVVLGMKNLQWHACNQPIMMPKPEMVALTGGYRRIPILQIGADLYFDSLFIIEELERRYPLRSVFSVQGKGLTWALSHWSDDAFFYSLVTILFASNDWDYDEAFLSDRSDLLGRPFDENAMSDAMPQAKANLRMSLQWLENQFSDGRRYLLGNKSEAIDAAAYFPLFFISTGKGASKIILKDYPLVCRWIERIKAIGYGVRLEDITGQQALNVASAAALVPLASDTVIYRDFIVGEKVLVHYHDANTPKLMAVLLQADFLSFTVRPVAESISHLHVHMPHTIATLEKAS